MPRLKIGIDIDGVLYPWDECARDALGVRFGIARPGPSLSWNWLKENLPREQWDWLWTAEGQDAVFRMTGRTYAGARDAINAILKAGHKCHFVTHRDPRRTALHTAAFLTHHFGGHPWAGVHVIQNGTPKHTLADWDVFIDDKPETVLAMLHETRARVFTPARPWNEELADYAEPSWNGKSRLTRYDDPAQVAEWVLAQ